MNYNFKEHRLILFEGERSTPPPSAEKQNSKEASQKKELQVPDPREQMDRLAKITAGYEEESRNEVETIVEANLPEPEAQKTALENIETSLACDVDGLMRASIQMQLGNLLNISVDTGIDRANNDISEALVVVDVPKLPNLSLYGAIDRGGLSYTGVSLSSGAFTGDVFLVPGSNSVGIQGSIMGVQASVGVNLPTGKLDEVKLAYQPEDWGPGLTGSYNPQTGDLSAQFSYGINF